MKSSDPDREPRISIVPVAEVPPRISGARTSKLLPFVKIARDLQPGKAVRVAAADRKDATRLRSSLYQLLRERCELRLLFRVADDAVYFWREAK